MPEIQDILLKYGSDYRRKHKLPLHILKTMSALENCRTASLGGHTNTCNDCGAIKISYNSCGNRHCPKCQNLSKERWIDSQKNSLLNVGYFHAVFTIPDTLNAIAFQNQDVVYTILFKAVAETLSELGKDEKYLGATLGFTSILHTWGQNLMHHPHIHCIIPSGGINANGEWISSKKDFFIPVNVLGAKFRGKFLYYLKEAYKNEKLFFFGDIATFSDKTTFNKFLTTHYEKKWIVYCKPPYENATKVIEYLGRYTHRVAISNSRIISIDDGKVSFKWRDYKDNSKWKVMVLTAEEFIRRFLVHILPPGFMKIRHYGFLGNRNKKTKLLLCKSLTNTPIIEYIKATTLELIEKIVGFDITKCSVCGSSNITQSCLPNKAPPKKATA